MTTYILGSNGKLGSVLHRHASRKLLGWKGQTRSGAGDVNWSGSILDAVDCEIFQPGAVIINMIGSTSQNEDELQSVNVSFVQELLQHAAKTGVAHIILASSAAVYGNGGETALTENAPLKPITPYGASKARMEDIVHATASRAGFPAITILRIGNVAGSDALLLAARNRDAKGEPMLLHRFANGTAPVRSYIGPRDLFDVVHALSHPHAKSIRTLNVAAPAPLSLDAVLKAYRTHLLPNLTWADAPVPAGVPPQVVLSTKTLERLVKLNWNTAYATDMAQQVAQDQAL